MGSGQVLADECPLSGIPNDTTFTLVVYYLKGRKEFPPPAYDVQDTGGDPYAAYVESAMRENGGIIGSVVRFIDDREGGYFGLKRGVEAKIEKWSNSSSFQIEGVWVSMNQCEL